MKRVDISVLVTSDVHGNIFPINYGNESYEPKGMGKAASVIRQIRQQEDHVLLVDNGDLIQGTPLAHFAMSQGEAGNHPSITVHNALQYDAAVLGNHEFNYGNDKLTEVMEQSQFPWLAGNVVKKGTREPYYGAPYLIREWQGVKVAVLGLTTKYVPFWEYPPHIQHLDFLDPVETAKEWVSYLRNEQQVDVVILSYHGGLEKDPETMEELVPNTGENQGLALATEVEGVDAVLTGHQHLLYATCLDNGVAVIQPGTGATHVGKLTITVDETDQGWKVADKKTELIATKDAAEAEDLFDAVRSIADRADDWLNEQIGRVEGDMLIEEPLQQVWLQEHPLTEWINRVMMNTAGTDIACNALLNPDAEGLPDTVTRRNVMSVYPFPNTLMVLEITGEELRQALEVSATFLEINEQGQVAVAPAWKKVRVLSYNYEMWEGIDYTIDLRRPEGERVVEASFKGVPLGKEKHRVAMSNYRASGTGGYDMFGPEKVVKEIQVDISEMLVRAVEEEKRITANANKNWQVIY